MPTGGSKRALHGSTPSMAKILCSDSIDPVREETLYGIARSGWDGWLGYRGAPPRPMANSVAPANTWHARWLALLHLLYTRSAASVLARPGAQRQSLTLTTTDPDTIHVFPIVDRDPQVCIQIFKERGHEVDYKVGLPKEELLKIIPQYDGACIDWLIQWMRSDLIRMD